MARRKKLEVESSASYYVVMKECHPLQLVVRRNKEYSAEVTKKYHPEVLKLSKLKDLDLENQIIEAIHVPNAHSLYTTLEF